MLTVILLGEYIKESLEGEGVSDSILSAMSPLKMVSNLSAWIYCSSTVKENIYP